MYDVYIMALVRVNEVYPIIAKDEDEARALALEWLYGDYTDVEAVEVIDIEEMGV